MFLYSFRFGIHVNEGCEGLTPSPATFTTTGLIEMLLARLVEMLLALLRRTLLTLERRRMHAAAAAIRFGTGLVAVTAHGRPRPVGAERVGAVVAGELMLHSAVTPDHAVISVAC